MRIVVLLPVATTWLLLAPSAIAERCECTLGIRASSESRGVCSRDETTESCHMTWATKAGAEVSLAPFHMQALGKSAAELKQLSDPGFAFKFTLPSTGAAISLGPKYLIETQPANYDGDKALSSYLLMLNAGMQRIGIKESLDIVLEIARNKSEVIKALKSDAPLSLSLKSGTLLVSKGCLEFKRPTASAMVNTPFSKKAASCG